MYNRIITHDDFDGLASASLCSYRFKISAMLFTGPRSVSDAQISITKNDIVCDLPYPLECGLWFDHHEGNKEALQYRGIRLNEIEGKFDLKPSCARVIYDYLTETGYSLPDTFKTLTDQTDIIDSFAFKSVEEWRAESPANIINNAIKSNFESLRARNAFLTNIVKAFKEKPLSHIAEDKLIIEKHIAQINDENRMFELIRNDACFLDNDHNQELIVLDRTRHKRQDSIQKQLAYLLYPEALGVIEIKNRFENKIKTNNLLLSMSLSMNLNGKAHRRDVGEIFRVLNIGDGHPGAGAAVIHCVSKDQMLKMKEQTVNTVFDIWRKMI